MGFAIILSSSKNPREYIQRRGRVLRTIKEAKKIAYIYDCITLPFKWDEDNKIFKPNQNDINLKILRGDIVRAKNFASNATNKSSVLTNLEVLMNNFDITEDEDK